MAKFDVGFEGEHKATFDTSPEACAWAAEAGDTGRRVFVVSRGVFGSRLVAVFPPEEMEGGVADWKASRVRVENWELPR
ncbi:hypothetical protein HJD18_11330 [Thermoleophilia bacterium SCSIO 60948]|nr:hypothetical protein HJD18_11330 [Thermoleophilia bacterium SCSIO 60948]